MTSQISDTFIYQGEEYYLVALKGEGLITPQDYGMQPQMLDTACYRGFYSTYEITDNSLFLTKMVIGQVEGEYKPIQGSLPDVPKGNKYGGETYYNLRLFTPFTGTIQLGKNFMREYSVNMGYHKASAYATLLEFSLSNGKIVSVKDLSCENSNQLGAFKNKFKKSNIEKAIADSFSLDIEVE